MIIHFVSGFVLKTVPSWSLEPGGVNKTLTSKPSVEKG